MPGWVVAEDQHCPSVRTFVHLLKTKERMRDSVLGCGRITSAGNISDYFCINPKNVVQIISSDY